MVPDGLLTQLSRAGMAALTACAVTFVLTPLVRSLVLRAGWVTKRVEARWGKRVVARFGGVAMFGGFIGASVLWVPIEPRLLGLLMGVSLVFVLGLVDDLHRIAPYTKLVVQLLIGCVVVINGIRIELVQWPWLAIPLSVMWFVLIMNAFNLLDNMDGLAAGVGAIAAGFFAFHAASAQQWTVVVLSAILAGTCLGFLRFNFPPAKIYMGDSGSQFIGLSLAALALLGTWHHSTQLLSVLAVPVLVLAVPIFDTIFVMIQRLMHRQHPFVGGTDHLSHRLAILGLSSRQTVMALYGLSVLFGLVSVVSVNLRVLPAVGIWLFVLTAMVLIGRYLGRVKVYRLEPQRADLRPPQPRGPVTGIETMLLHKRRVIEILVDFCLLSSAYVFAYLLRFEGALSPWLSRLIVQSLPVILVIKLACFGGCGLYRGVWRYVGVADILTIFRAVTLGSILSSMALLFLWRFEGYSRAVFIIDWMLCLLAVGGARVLERLLDEWIHRLAARGLPVVIVGAGDTGERVLRYLRYAKHTTHRVVGFLDDDLSKRGSRIHGTSVLGDRRQLGEILDRHGIREVLIAITDPPGELLQYVQRLCEPRGVSWKVVTAGVTDAV